MSEPFLSEIKVFSFGFPPKGWTLCDGQLLPINQNQALFSLLGTTYGGDGRVNFGLPNLQGRCAMHMGNGHTLGERGGEQAHTLSISELPTHTHLASCDSGGGNQSSPKGQFWAKDNADAVLYNTAVNSTMNPVALANVGGSQAHLNMAPFLTLNFCIALQGIFPSQT